MRILGIDPSPTGIAWAIYDDRATRVGTLPDPPDIVEWGTCENWCEECQVHLLNGRLARWEYAAIEWPVIYPGAGNSVRDTIATAGLWWGRLGEGTLRITRSTVASALHAKGDAAINRAMSRYCPRLDQKLKDLTNDIRAAAAVAFVAAGRVGRVR